jgi:hypothetical protein
MIIDGVIEPLELGHLPFRKKTFEDYVSEHALEKSGKKKWTEAVFETVSSSPQRWSGLRPCWEAGAPANSTSYRRAAGSAPTRTHSSAAFASGIPTGWSTSELLPTRSAYQARDASPTSRGSAPGRTRTIH